MIVYQITNPIKGYRRPLYLDNTVESALALRHAGGILYDTNKKRETFASHLGLDYGQVMRLRRSPEFAKDVETYITENPPLVNDKETQEWLGVVTHEEGSLGRDGKQLFTDTTREEVVEMLVEFIRKNLRYGLKYSQGEYISPDYVKEIIENHLVLDDAGISAPPRVTKKQKPISKSQRLQHENDLLRKKLADAGLLN